MTTGLLDPAAAVRACVVALGGEPFALDMAAVREVVVFDDWTTVPLAPPHVVGAANLRGVVMPIVDARALLRLPPRRPERRVRTLVLAAGGLEAALVIDGVLALESFMAVVPVDEAPNASRGRHRLGFVERDDARLPLLDAASLLQALRPAPGGDV